MNEAPAILTCEEVREAERRSVDAGIATMAGLMERAGEACARVLHEAFPAGKIVVLAGPGNNGGDAFVAARFLKAWGRDINLYELAGGRRTAEAASARAAWTGDIAPIVQLEGGEGVLLDGLFGAGLSRPLAGEALEAVMRAARVQGPKVAIDLPSGLQGDGAAHAACAPADITVTFGALKPVHVLQPAAQACGRVVVEEIGFGACLGRPNVHLNGPELWRLQWPTPTSHKHQRGRLFVVTGGLASTGAARLAARAGLRLCGSSTLLCPPAAMIVVAQSVEAVMTRSFDGPAALVEASERAQAVVIGPAAGVDAKTRANVEALGQAGRRLVLDADALSVFAGEATALKSALKAPAVLTPHAGEFERLFPGLLAASPNKIDAARAAAKQVEQVVLLKGFDTVTAAPDGRAAVNTHASPFLATAGSGDVLAGIVGGLLTTHDAFDAACIGAWLHGDAGLRVGPGLIAEDLDVALRQSLAALYPGGGA